MNRIFVDTNILLDVYQQRDGYFESLQILRLCEQKTLRGYITAASVYTCAYFLESRPDFRKRLQELLQIMHIANTGKNTLLQALKSKFADVEDAFQYHAALNIAADGIITRNTKDFKFSKIPVYTPAQLLQRI